MKGRTTIELIDTKTGAKEVIESENMVTNALTKYFTNLGMLNTSAFNSSDMRGDGAIFKLLGGLLLFDNTIEENIDNILAPAGVGMTGNAAYGITSNDSVLEFGSCNATESGWQADGSLKFVYEFATNQANGDIACVCLSSFEHGYIGEGNKSGKQKSSSRDDLNYPGDYNYLLLDGKYLNHDYPRIVCIDPEESTVTVIDRNNLYYSSSAADEFYGNTGKLKLMKYRIPLSKYDLRDTQNKHILLEEKEIDLPEDFITFVKANSPTSIRCRTLCVTDFVYIIYEADTSYNRESSVIMILKINPDYTMESYKVVNQTGVALYNISGNNTGFVLSDKLVLRSRSSEEVYCINIKNSADFCKISNVASLNMYSVSRNQIMSFTHNKAHLPVGVIDLERKEILPINTTKRSYGGPFAGTIKDNSLIQIRDSSESSGGTFTLMRSMNYLATINNLENKVTKTSDKTMKITYTLTF